MNGQYVELLTRCMSIAECVIVIACFVHVISPNITIIDVEPEVDRGSIPLGSPVILIPGLGGSQLEASLNRTSTLHYICTKQSNWYTIWLSITELTWPLVECFADNLRLIYDPHTKTTRNNEGVDIRVSGFGSTDTVDYLDWFHSPLSSYFAHITKRLITTKAYLRGVNLHGAPYDFRKGPSELDVFFRNLTVLVESTYSANSNQQVTLIAHSMGCPLTLIWLNKQSSAWKRKYIKWFIPIAGPWAGSLKSIRLIISGDNINLYIVNPLYVRPIQRSSPSTFFLFPYADEWAEDEILIQTPSANYTVKDYKRLFADVNHPNANEIRDKEIKYYNPYKAPNVPVYAFYGNNVKTPLKFIYNSAGVNWMDKQPTIIYESGGDGTVNERSLKLIEKWKQKENCTLVELNSVEHLAIMSNPVVINTILELISS
ncbi:hypothetical protein GJ496_010923 [Pomphorhynchus laevis]|nr:hypothetical protein GJ496_010923 [Pomphorhynchus laevis]